MGHHQLTRSLPHSRSRGGRAAEAERPLAFAQYRFVEEDERAVLYIYELQLAPAARRKGVGKFLTQVLPPPPTPIR